MTSKHRPTKKKIETQLMLYLKKQKQDFEVTYLWNYIQKSLLEPIREGNKTLVDISLKKSQKKLLTF